MESWICHRMRAFSIGGRLHILAVSLLISLSGHFSDAFVGSGISGPALRTGCSRLSEFRPRVHTNPRFAHSARQGQRLQPRMLFSIPDLGNLIAAPAGTRPKTGPIWAQKQGADIWMFEQPIGFLNITVNIRMTVIRLEDGSLLVKDPIAPTQQCVDALRELGEVKHIVLGTTALEHKYFCRAFVDKFPAARIFVPPGIFNFVPGRTDLQPPGLGLFVDLVRPMRIDGYLTPGFGEATLNGVTYPSSEVPPWASELAHELLFFDAPPVANAAEVAFFHRASKTLLVLSFPAYEMIPFKPEPR